MREVSLAEIIKMEPGEDIPSFRCVLKKVGPYIKGENSFGNYTLQNLIATDGKDSLKIKLDGRPELGPEWANQTVIFEAGKGTKKLFLDLKRDVDTYRDTKNPMIWIGPLAAMNQVSKAPAPVAEPAKPAPRPQAPVEKAPPSPQPQPQPQPATAPKPALPPKSAPATQQPRANNPASPVAPAPELEPELPPAPVQKVGIPLARDLLGKNANALLLAFDAAFYVRKYVAEKHGEQLSLEAVQKLAVHMSIGLERKFATTELPAGLMPGYNKTEKPKS